MQALWPEGGILVLKHVTLETPAFNKIMLTEYILLLLNTAHDCNASA
jgi:hypothetical protein